MDRAQNRKALRLIHFLFVRRYLLAAERGRCGVRACLRSMRVSAEYARVCGVRGLPPVFEDARRLFARRGACAACLHGSGQKCFRFRKFRKKRLFDARAAFFIGFCKTGRMICLLRSVIGINLT